LFSAPKKLRKSTRPSFFNPSGIRAVEQTFNWKDPFTMLGFILGLLRKYSNWSLIKNKFGNHNSA
jgi:hypothetical protein